MPSVLRSAFLASLCLAALAGTAFAQSGPARSRVVVTLNATADFASFERDFSADERTRRPSAAYHRRGVLGAIMRLERAHGFRADAFFSRALNGFAASLTTAQIEALARHPMVERIEPDIAM